VLHRFKDRAEGVDGGLEGRVRLGELYLIFGGHGYGSIVVVMGYWGKVCARIAEKQSHGGQCGSNAGIPNSLICPSIPLQGYAMT